MKLLKAEWFRFWNTKRVWIVLVFFAAFFSVYPLRYVESYEMTIGELKGMEYITMLGSCLDYLLYPLLLILITGYYMHSQLAGKTIYYEWMNEKNKGKVLVGKGIVAVVISAISTGFVFVVYCIFSLKNGIGDGEWHHILFLMGTMFVMCFHLVYATILISICLRNGNKASLISFFRYYACWILWQLVVGNQEISGEKKMILEMMEPASLYVLFGEIRGMQSLTIFAVTLLSMIINCLLLFCITKWGAEKKDWM